jgi:hypothetical protein
MVAQVVDDISTVRRRRCHDHGEEEREGICPEVS